MPSIYPLVVRILRGGRVCGLGGKYTSANHIVPPPISVNSGVSTLRTKDDAALDMRHQLSPIPRVHV